MTFRSTLSIALTALVLGTPVFAADNLKLNQHLDYSSDSQDGPLIGGDNLAHGAVAGKVNYIIVYGEGCFNSKRQARRTVELYRQYKGRVNFVIVDLDHAQSAEQQALVKSYYDGYIPNVTVLDRSGHALYNHAGEVASATIAALFDHALTH